ncbi:hypothetical protein IAQ61_001669 [Plenodomus lingam]|uniref:Uncharacterized protein n=1 Tax=Leptosphaeria maculans (strain JN3 / isolate v23.1.3 / race Av1-4-5-6-7-8) TaxID=985895 RepID=E4ZFU9_LEPMJ|nr:hypothetical protein LEMA_P062950.1 [Plenodomus lingam JN3]KAH9878397.1 hypothetical protein IAQ61_001669 [Plenodomus lingam]CBX90169.1 hypothetical protein LEMA_P062950.1 [Plenodomus lingam JN3]
MLNQVHKSFSKMHARRNPNLSIQSTASYSQLSPQVQSATSAVFLSPTVASRRGLLSGRSPPPSPNLPSLIPRHGKKKTQQSAGHSRTVKTVLIGCCGVLLLCWMVLRQIYTTTPHGAVNYEDETSGDEWEMVGGAGLPQEPSAVAVQDAKGKMRWTVSIPHDLDFPLRPSQYRDICHTSMELAKSIRQDAQKSSTKRMLAYYQKDEYYIDVKDAEEQGLLPPSKAAARPKGFVEDEAIADGISVSGLKVCDRTLTYVMETEDAGFGNSLMRLWMSYGLAKAENRTFFIDDTRWPYGKYKSYFLPPPTASCAPPPPSHIVPCPHTASHLIVSGATIRQTFGHAFTNEWEDATKMRVARQRKIFGLARTGYEALFKLRTDDAAYIDQRALDLYQDVQQQGGLSIAIHVRHGDKHPYEYQYSKDYIPLSHYVDTARDLYIDLVENKRQSGWKRKPNKSNDDNVNNNKNNIDILNLHPRHPPAPMILASDDPLVYLTPDLGTASHRAQDRIVLATKAAIEANAPGAKKSPWIDEITGWEGGFYRDVFFSLGQPVGNAGDLARVSPASDDGAADADAKDVAVPEQAMKLRELVGRAYLLDLSVLGRADSVVCGVASTSCRLLAVMLGWEAAIEQARWRNVDGGFEWRGIVW